MEQVHKDLETIYKRLIEKINTTDNISDALSVIDRVLAIVRILKRKQPTKKVEIDEIIEELSNQ